MSRRQFNASFVCRQSEADKSGYSTIYLSLVINGERKYMALPKRAVAKDFKKLLSSKKDNDIKVYCNTILQRVYEIQTNLTIKNEPITPSRIIDYFKNGATKDSYTLGEMFKEGLAIKSAENRVQTTYNKYRNATEHFLAMTKHKATDEASYITNNDILLYKAELTKTYEPPTVAKELQYIKYFFTRAFNSGKIRQNPFLDMKIRKNSNEDTFYLTDEEVRTIKNHRITNDSLSRVRDTFLFMCWTGLEYADMEQLHKDDVKTNTDGQHYIKKKRIKDGVEYTTILQDDAPELWSIYEGEIPLLSNQKFNKYLKVLGRECGIQNYERITTLTARHTFAIHMLNTKKVDISVLSKMLGHTNLQQSRHYAKLLDKSVFEATKETKTEEQKLLRPIIRQRPVLKLK